MLTRFTDSDCDIDIETAKKYGYKLISMPYILNGQEVYPYESWEKFDSKTFYDNLRTCKELPSTFGLSIEKYRSYFEPEFEKGNDVIYVHFSGAMSGTFNAMDLAVKALKEKYPERKFYSVDALAISIGGRRAAMDLAEYIDAGHTGEEAEAYGKEMVHHYAVYFFADDLKFFAKSGRVSGFKAFFGGLLGIKPIINMNDEGIMAAFDSAKGKMNAIKKLANKYGELATEPGKGLVTIAESGNVALAEEIRSAMSEKYKDLQFEIVTTNPTAGCHCGPNATGICFKSKKR